MYSRYTLKDIFGHSMIALGSMVFIFGLSACSGTNSSSPSADHEIAGKNDMSNGNLAVADQPPSAPATNDLFCMIGQPGAANVTYDVNALNWSEGIAQIEKPTNFVIGSIDGQIYTVSVRHGQAVALNIEISDSQLKRTVIKSRKFDEGAKAPKLQILELGTDLDFACSKDKSLLSSQSYPNVKAEVVLGNTSLK